MPDEYYLKCPSEHTFYKFLSFTMGIYGLNTEAWHWYTPMSNKLYHIQRYVTIIFVPICTFSQIFYLGLNYPDHDFASLAVMFAIMPVGCVIMVKSASAQTSPYKKVMRSFMEKIHLHNFIDQQRQDQRQTFIAEKLVQAEKYTRWSFYFLTSSTLICYSAWNIVPIIHNFQNNHSIYNITVRLELVVHMWMPFDYQFSFYGYMIMLIIGAYVGLVGTIIIVLYDTNNLAFIYHLVGHIEIIKNDLRTVFSKNMSEAEIKLKLIDVTKYYQFITDTFKDVEAVFGLNVASVYAQNLVQGGLMIFMLMTNGRNVEVLLTYGLMIPIIMGSLIVMSLVLENIRIQAEDIPTYVYFLPWESMTLRNQKILLSIIVQVQPTLEFKAAFDIKTGVQPALNIIKTTFSYYLMIKANRQE